MRVAHTGDIHWGLGYPGPTPASRFEDISRVADFMADRIIEERCELVLIAGDLFKDARVFIDRASVEIAAAAAWLRKLSDAGIPVVVISGTPSHDAVAAYELIKEMRIPNVHIFTTPGVFDYGCSIACLPGVNRSTIASKEEYARMPAHELHQLMTDRITQVVHGLAAECVNDTKILLSHITCSGADKGYEDLLQQQEPILTSAAIEGARFDLVCLGHIHKAHQIKGLSVPTYYCGSPERLRFDEEESTPGFWIYDIDIHRHTGLIKADFIKTPARRYWTLDLSEEDPDAVVKVLNNLKECLAGAPVKDAVVRVRYEVTEAQAKQISRQAIVRDLYELGAYYVQGVEARVKRETRTRAAEANAGMTPAEALAMWGRVNGVPEEELAELSKRAAGLEQEVGI